MSFDAKFYTSLASRRYWAGVEFRGCLLRLAAFAGHRGDKMRRAVNQGRIIDVQRGRHDFSGERPMVVENNPTPVLFAGKEKEKLEAVVERFLVSVAG